MFVKAFGNLTVPVSIMFWLEKRLTKPWNSINILSIAFPGLLDYYKTCDWCIEYEPDCFHLISVKQKLEKWQLLQVIVELTIPQPLLDSWLSWVYFLLRRWRVWSLLWGEKEKGEQIWNRPKPTNTNTKSNTNQKQQITRSIVWGETSGVCTE